MSETKCTEEKWSTVEGGGNGVQGVAVGPGDDAMMAYGGTTGNGGAMGPSSGGTDVLGSTGDYSPQGTPTPLTGHSAGPVEATTYGPGTGPASYSPQDSPASSAGGGSGSNGQLSSFGFTQEQVACVCEVSFKKYYCSSGNLKFWVCFNALLLIDKINSVRAVLGDECPTERC